MSTESTHAPSPKEESKAKTEQESELTTSVSTEQATSVSTEQATASMRESMVLLQQIEWTALAIGAVLIIGSWLVRVPMEARWAVIVGVAFSSINFRLLIWSWSWLFQTPDLKQAVEGRRTTIPRFLLKYVFLLAGLGLLIGGLNLHVVGFMIGLGNVILAVALAPLMMQSMRPPQGSPKA